MPGGQGVPGGGRGSLVRSRYGVAKLLVLAPARPEAGGLGGLLFIIIY